MEMQQIRYFLSLARTLNFTRAAEACNVSQPSLTRSISLLEAELGGELIRRERRQSHLTELGQRMLPLLQQCYDSATSAKKLARSIKNNEIAPLSVAISRTINIALLTHALSELSRAYPGIQLKVRRGTGAEINKILKDGEAELALAGPLDEAWERLDRWPIFEEGYVLVVAPDHALAERESVEIAEVARERLILQVGCEMGEELTQRLEEAGISKTGCHEVDTDHDALALAGARLCLAILPASGPKANGLRCVPLSGFDVRRPIAVYGIAGRRRSAVATTLLNMLRAADWSDYAH